MELIQVGGTRRDWGEDYFETWREDWAIQAWMERLYRTNGNTGNFNETEFCLSGKDIDQLEADMPHLKEFCAKAREAFKEDQKVFYSSWWMEDGWEW